MNVGDRILLYNKNCQIRSSFFPDNRRGQTFNESPFNPRIGWYTKKFMAMEAVLKTTLHHPNLTPPPNCIPKTGVKRQLINLVRLVVHPGVVRVRGVLHQLCAVLLGRRLPRQGEAARAAEQRAVHHARSVRHLGRSLAPITRVAGKRNFCPYFSHLILDVRWQVSTFY